MSTIDANLFDHVIFLLLLVGLPAGGWYSVRKVRRQLAAGVPYTTRIADYRNNMLIMWGVTLALLVLWLFLGRDWAVLGLLPPGGGYGYFSIALLMGIGLIGLNAYSEMQVRKSDEVARAFVEAARDFEFALPHSERDLRWFYGMSVTAGVTEEVLYRGFLIAYFSSFVPTVGAVLLSTLIFGVAHSYQGGKGVIKTAVVGLVLATMYVLSGSLLLPIIAHILVDVFGGRAIYRAYNRIPPAAAPQEAC